MELIILYLPLFILIYSFYSLPINPGFPVVMISNVLALESSYEAL